MAADIPVPADVRRRLLDTLDLFGIALGGRRDPAGQDAAQVRALLRRTSGVDAVLSHISIAGAEVRYRRVLDAVAELEALAVGRATRSGSVNSCPTTTRWSRGWRPPSTWPRRPGWTGIRTR